MFFAKAVVGEEVSMPVWVEVVSVQIVSSPAALLTVQLEQEARWNLNSHGVLLHAIVVSPERAKR